MRRSAKFPSTAAAAASESTGWTKGRALRGELALIPPVSANELL